MCGCSVFYSPNCIKEQNRVKFSMLCTILPYLTKGLLLSCDLKLEQNKSGILILDLLKV